MAINTYKDPLVIKWWTDDEGEKISVKRQNESQKIVQNQFTLTEIPDEQYGVIINGYTEVRFGEIVEPNEFVVNYTLGQIKFHPSKEGMDININEYWSRGIIYYPANRIYTKLNEAGDKVLETLQDFIDINRDFVDELIEIKAEYYDVLRPDIIEKTNFAQTQGEYAQAQGDRIESNINEYENTLRPDIINKTNYAEVQGDYAKAQGTFAQTQGERAEANSDEYENTLRPDIINKTNYAEVQGDYAKAQGDYANDRGDYADNRGDYADDRGNFANVQGTTAKAHGEFAQTQGNYALSQGDYAGEQAGKVDDILDNFRPFGQYSPTLSYVPYNTVMFNGHGYMNIQASQGINPENDSYWVKLVERGEAGYSVNYKGEYDNSTAYIEGDMVSVGDDLFLARVNTTGNAPPNEAYWFIYLDHTIKKRLQDEVISTRADEYDFGNTPMNTIDDTMEEIPNAMNPINYTLIGNIGDVGRIKSATFAETFKEYGFGMLSANNVDGSASDYKYPSNPLNQEIISNTKEIININDYIADMTNTINNLIITLGNTNVTLNNLQNDYNSFKSSTNNTISGLNDRIATLEELLEEPEEP